MTLIQKYKVNFFDNFFTYFPIYEIYILIKCIIYLHFILVKTFSLYIYNFNVILQIINKDD